MVDILSDSVMSCVCGILAVLVYFLVISIFNFFYEKRQLFKFSKYNGGPPFYPFIGNAFRMLGKNLLPAVDGFIQNFGTPCNIWVCHDFVYITTNADELKIILNHPNTFEKGPTYKYFELAFKDSLLVAPAEVWKHHRKFYAKSFNQPILNTFVQHFYDKSIILLDRLRNSKNKDKFQIFQRYTYDSFCASVLGIDYDFQMTPAKRLIELLDELQEILGTRLIESYYLPDIIFYRTARGKHGLKGLAELKQIIRDILKEKRQAFEESATEYVVDKKMLPLLKSMLLAGDQEFTDEQIFKETILFLTAGSTRLRISYWVPTENAPIPFLDATDTTGNTLAFTCMFLGMNPDIQEKVYQEVIRTVGHDRQISHDDLPYLKYTERVILETMRLLPPAPFFSRVATSDVDLGSKVLPKGANVLISAYHVQRNETYWPNPLKFDPDRFLPEEVAKRHPYAFLSFSGGPRNCIGKTYGMMLLKTCLANVIRNYEMFSKYKSVTELKLVSSLTMKTEHNLDCQFKLRKHNNVNTG